MPTKTVEIQQTEEYLTQLLSLLEDGSEVILTQRDTPVAKLVPVPPPSDAKRSAGLHTGAIWMSEDFDTPLPENFWLGQK